MSLQGITVSAPYGGLDVVSPIDRMEEQYALELVNIFPGASAPSVRQGYISWKGVAGSNVQTLATLTLADGTQRLIVCWNGTNNAYISGFNTNKVGGTLNPGLTLYSSAEFYSVVYNNRIYLCNGLDIPVYWDGSAATVSNVTFTGPTMTSLVNVTAYKERLYFVERGTCKVWYGGLQVTGTGGTPALTAFDFSYVFTRGGRLIGIGSYSNTANLATQDYFWACSSEGEIVFYTGTYAGDPTTWGLVARYYIGAPLSYRAFIRVNNDVWILTRQGIVPISALFQSDPEQSLYSVSYRVNPIISKYATLVGFDHQWHGFFWPQGRRVYISVPSSGEGCFFLVYSIDTKAWTTFKLVQDADALCSTLFNNLPFYGNMSGTIWQGETGYVDAQSATADPYFNQAITFSGRMAYNFFGSRGNYKAFKDIRPLLKTQKGFKFNLGFDTDFKVAPNTPTVTLNPGTFTPWGSPWGSPWSADVDYVYDRFATKGQGHNGSIRFAGAIKDSPLEIYGFEVRFDVGGQV
jgi:hypothetical protein